MTTASPEMLQLLMDKIRILPAERIAEIVDFVDFLRFRVTTQAMPISKKSVLDMPILPTKRWDYALDLSREGMYGDDGR